MPRARSDRIDLRGPGDREPLTAPALIEHVFRHEYGRLVAMLARRVGVEHLARVEDAVQSALESALAAWPTRGAPDDPTAWLYRVAYNQLIQDLRRSADRARILARAGVDLAGVPDDAMPPTFPDEIRDDMLRMLFVCCDEGLPSDSQIVLALKTLCGFSTGEIALRLFTSEANVHKRLFRARERLQETPPDLQTPPLETMRSRLPGVHAVLYLLFNEGYLSVRPEEAIRRELCDEAIRLATLLAEHPVGAVPDTFALCALMHLHVARFAARVDATGGLLLLEEQDRSRWDRAEMQIGAEWLQRSAIGDVFSRWHAEAGIAAAHCFSPSFAETRWDEVADLYAMLERIAPSPLHTLNRAVAVAEWRGAEAGLAVLDALAPPSWLVGSYLWDAVLADLHRRAGHPEIAQQHRERALDAAPTDALRDLVRRRLATGDRA